MKGGIVKKERVESEQDEEEDVYEVERIIEMRVEEGEVLYRVRWKGYCSDDDTWEPEAHLEDCRKVLLAFKKATTDGKKEAEAKKVVQKALPTKSDLFEADSESDSDKDRLSEAPVKKKKKKKVREEEEELQPRKEKKKNKWRDEFKTVSAPETDEEETVPPSPPESKEKQAKQKKHLIDSDDEEEELAPPKKDKTKDGGKHRKDRGEKGKKKKAKKERKIESSEDEGPAGLIEDDRSEGLSDAQLDETSAKPPEKTRMEDKAKHKKGKLDVKLQGIKELILDRKSKKGDFSLKESSLHKLKSLTSRGREEAAPHSSDSSDSSSLHKKAKSKSQEVVSKPSQGYGFSLDSDEREAQKSATKPRPGDDSRERRERLEESQRLSWERKGPADDRKKRREDGEPKLHGASDSHMSSQDPLETTDKSDRGPAALSLGMDLNLDWMTLDDFQKHLNGEDEILSAPLLSPSELRDAVKSGDYTAVKLALNSKEQYNLDQEDVSGMSLSMLAAAGGQDDILRLLIRKGVRINGRQKNGTTALMHAAEKNCVTTVAILLEAGSHVNAQTLGGETALMKACKRGNGDIVRLLLESGADCSILSKHKTTALYFAKLSNNLAVCDLINNHTSMLSSVAEDTVRAYFETRLVLLEPIFPLACHRLCERSDFFMEFAHKPQPPIEGTGLLLFIFHANFLGDVSARLGGPCSVHAVVLNDKFQLPVFLDSHFIYSFTPLAGNNKLSIRLSQAHTAKVKLLIGAYRVQLQ